MTGTVKIRTRDEVSRELVDALEQRRRDEMLYDAAFAAKLGVARAVWANTRTGRMQTPPELLLGAFRAYPELRELIVEAKQHCRSVLAIEQLSALGIQATP